MTRNTTEFLAGGITAVLLALGVGLAAGWSFWGTAALALGLAGVWALVLRAWHDRLEQAALREDAAERQRLATEPPPAPPQPEPEPEPTSREVTEVMLPSLLDGISFTVGCTVHWSTTDGWIGDEHADPAAIAVEAVLLRAAQVTVRHRPEDGTVVHALAAALGEEASDGRGRLVAWATGPTVAVAPEHRAQVRDLATLRQRWHLQEQQIINQRRLREYLGGEILTDVSSAVVWWLARDDKQVRETVDLIDTLAQLSAAATNANVPEPHGRPLPEPVAPREERAWFAEEATHTDSALLPDPDDPDNALFGHQLADLLDRFGHPALAGATRQSFRTIDVADAAPTADEAESREPFFPGLFPGTGEPNPPMPTHPEPPAGPDETRAVGG